MYDLTAEDGTTVGVYKHAWTRERLLLADDGRLFHREDDRVVEGGDPDEAMRRFLPSPRAWLTVGGYAPGDLLGPPLPDEELAI